MLCYIGHTVHDTLWLGRRSVGPVAGTPAPSVDSVRAAVAVRMKDSAQLCKPITGLLLLERRRSYTPPSRRRRNKTDTVDKLPATERPPSSKK